MKPLIAAMLTALIIVAFPIILMMIPTAFIVWFTDATWHSAGESEGFWFFLSCFWFVAICAGGAIYQELEDWS